MVQEDRGFNYVSEQMHIYQQQQPLDHFIHPSIQITKEIILKLNGPYCTFTSQSYYCLLLCRDVTIR